jgi:thiol-disulfide isomerase/thioredoxin
VAGDDQREGGWWPEEEPGEERPPERETRPPRGLASREAPPKPPARYSYFVGVAFVVIAAIALINLLRDNDAGILGVSSTDRGAPLAEFAVPDARGTSEDDANVFQDDCGSSRNPCPEDDRRAPACAIDPAGAIRVCDLFDKPLAISFWFTRGGDCLPAQDAFDAVARRYRGRVNFLSVDIRDDRDTVRGIIDERGWSVPVGLDPDGAVSNLYRVGGCPTIVLAYPGGILHDAVTSEVSIDSADEAEREIAADVDELLRASRQRAATSR